MDRTQSFRHTLDNVQGERGDYVRWQITRAQSQQMFHLLLAHAYPSGGVRMQRSWLQSIFLSNLATRWVEAANMSASISELQQEHFLRIHAMFQVAMPLLRKQGFWQDIEGYPTKVRAFENSDLLMLHRTPFQPVPISDKAQDAGVTALSQKEIARGYGLDVWWTRRKVMSLIWNDGGALGVIVYKEGPWQPYLEQLGTLANQGKYVNEGQPD